MTHTVSPSQNEEKLKKYSRIWTENRIRVVLCCVCLVAVYMKVFLGLCRDCVHSTVHLMVCPRHHMSKL